MSKANFDKHSLAPDPNVRLPASHAGTESIGLDTLLNLMNDPLRTPVEGAPDGSSLRIIGPTNVLSATTPKTLGTPFSGRVINSVGETPTQANAGILPKLPESFEKDGEIWTKGPVVPVAPKPAGPAPTRIFFTGRIGVGKDFLASAIGASVFGFADPLYALATRLFGVPVSADSASKSTPGIRESLQRIGQLGRGTVSPQYPLTLERALLVEHLRKLGPEVDTTVAWDEFGSDPEIWLEACLCRVAYANPLLAAVTNVRFENEFKGLTEMGYVGYHVMASDATLAQRRGPGFSPAAANDVSEQLARKLDQSALQAARHPGTRLRVIWSDSAASPSPRFMSVEYFQSIFGI